MFIAVLYTVLNFILKFCFFSALHCSAVLLISLFLGVVPGWGIPLMHTPQLDQAPVDSQGINEVILPLMLTPQVDQAPFDSQRITQEGSTVPLIHTAQLDQAPVDSQGIYAHITAWNLTLTLVLTLTLALTMTLMNPLKFILPNSRFPSPPSPPKDLKNLEWLYIWAVVWDNLWERRGGSMVTGVLWEVPESNQCTP